jgi:hypothetical protein
VTVPAVDVKAPPLIEYSPPVMEIALAALIPEMVISLEGTAADNAVPACAVNVKALGVVSTGGGGVGVESPPPPPPQAVSSASKPIDTMVEIRRFTPAPDIFLLVIRGRRNHSCAK